MLAMETPSGATSRTPLGRQVAWERSNGVRAAVDLCCPIVHRSRAGSGAAAIAPAPARLRPT